MEVRWWGWGGEGLVVYKYIAPGQAIKSWLGFVVVFLLEAGIPYYSRLTWNSPVLHACLDRVIFRP